MNRRVLFVDDEPNVLDGIRRHLRKEVDLHTAVGAAAGLELMRETGEFAVVVSDMRMPEMNGSQFLARVRSDWPDSVRMILSGQSDIESTIAAVNDGHIFRFLTKPCDGATLLATIQAGLRQYELIHAERQLLEQTLSGAVKLLTEILGLTHPAAHQRTTRLRRYAEAMADAISLRSDWEFRLALDLSQLGCITLPTDILRKVLTGEPMSGDERQMYDAHPELAARLLGSIPRLEHVAEIIGKQHHVPASRDIQWQPDGPDRSMATPLLLYLASEFDRRVIRGMKPSVAAEELGTLLPGLPPAIQRTLVDTHAGMERQLVPRSVALSGLLPGMLLEDDVCSAKVACVVPSGQVVSTSMIVRLRSVAEGIGIREPIKVLSPA